jgi:LytS/YehU family sensor histidine kinase
LRYIIYDGKKPLVDVGEDLKCIENYLALECVRYGSKLQLQFSVSGDSGTKKIPPLLLLPFIENSFKHGISNDHKACWIRCEIHLSEDNLEMDLKNSIVQYPEEAIGTSGIGIANVRQLLEHTYQEQYSLINERQDDSYHVNLKIPLSKS